MNNQLFKSTQKLVCFCTLIFFNSIAVAEVEVITRSSGTINGINDLDAINGQLINNATISMINTSRGDGINSSEASSVITNNYVISIQSRGTLLGGRGGDGIDARGGATIVNNAEGASISVGTNLLTRTGYAINLSGLGSTINNEGQILSGLGALGSININVDAESSIFRNTGVVEHVGLNSSAIRVNGNNTEINNTGRISVAGIAAHGILNNADNVRIINNGVILTQDSIPFIRNINQDIFGSFAIRNTGSIETLVNGQGGDASADNRIALTYSGNLPTNYEIVVTDSTRYGQLFVRGRLDSEMIFAINDQTNLRKGIYERVLVGVGLGNLVNQQGNYKGFTFQLKPIGDSNDINSLAWDMIVTGAYTADTQSSLEISAQRLKGIYNLQSTVVVNGLTYDCRLFDINNICLSTGGRYSNNHGASGYTTSALLIGAYRLNENVRLGAWIDQSLSTNTVAGINLGNSKPLLGVFGAWAENPSGEGYEVKVSAGYGDKDITVTRDVIGTSEAGFGNTRLNSQAISTVSSFGFKLSNNLLVSPYVGVQYSRISSSGYTEASTADVTAPLTYSRLSQENISFLAGLKLSAKLDSKTTLFGSVGVEKNANNRSGQYSATGDDGLTAINFNSNVQKTRAIASAGVSYDIDKKQRVSLNGIYREEAFNPTATTAAFATYTVGL
jgi:hypothetical protein